MMEVKPWFSNFIAHSYLKEIDNEKLKKYCLQLKRTNKGRIISNHGGWQSKDLNLKVPIIDSLVKTIEKEIPFFVNLLSIKKDYNLKLINLWASINKQSDMNRPHVHPKTILAGVYYVTAPPDCGDIWFMNPNPIHFHSVEKIVTEWNIYTASEVFFKSEVSKLLIFPAHLMHYVLPNQTKKDRISLSFNIAIKGLSKGSSTST